MSPDGKPIQVNASTLQAAAAQNAVGMLYISKSDNSIITRIVITSKATAKQLSLETVINITMNSKKLHLESYMIVSEDVSVTRILIFC